MHNKDVVTTPPDSWGVIFDGTSYSGKVDAYDSPIYIADAAVYLKSSSRPQDHRPLRADA